MYAVPPVPMSVRVKEPGGAEFHRASLAAVETFPPALNTARWLRD